MWRQPDAPDASIRRIRYLCARSTSLTPVMSTHASIFSKSSGPDQTSLTYNNIPSLPGHPRAYFRLWVDMHRMDYLAHLNPCPGSAMIWLTYSKWLWDNLYHQISRTVKVLSLSIDSNLTLVSSGPAISSPVSIPSQSPRSTSTGRGGHTSPPISTSGLSHHAQAEALNFGLMCSTTDIGYGWVTTRWGFSH